MKGAVVHCMEHINFYDVFMYYRDHPDDIANKKAEDKKYKKEIEDGLKYTKEHGHTIMDFRAVGKTIKRNKED